MFVNYSNVKVRKSQQYVTVLLTLEIYLQLFKDIYNLANCYGFVKSL